MVWATVLPALISAGTSIAGASTAASGNNKAARQAIVAQQQAADTADRIYAEAGGIRAEGIGQGAEMRVTGLDAGTQWREYAQVESARQIEEALAEASRIESAARQEAARLSAAGYREQARQVLEGMQMQLGIIEQQIMDYRQGTSDTLGRLEDVRAENAPGQQMLRELVADPGSLTPYQQKQLEDLRRQTGDTIRSSSLAGSGRTMAAVFKDVESNYVLGAQEQNRQAALQAAGIMAGNSNSAMMSMADVVMRGAQMVGGARTSQANIVGSGVREAAGAGVNAANAEAQGVGDVGGIQGNAAIDIGRTRGAGTLGQFGARADLWAQAGGLRGDAIERGAGAVASGREAAGNARVGAIANAGNIAAQSTAANSQIWSDTLGSVGSVIADGFKRNQNKGTEMAAPGAGKGF